MQHARNPENQNQILEETNAVLSKIKVRTYSLGGVPNPENETQPRSIRTLKDRLEKTCIELNDVTDNDGVVTLEVSGMVVAACVLKRKTFDHVDEEYYSVSITCSVDAFNLKAYVIREAERYALKRDVFYMKIHNSYATVPPVDFRRMISYFGTLGYNATPRFRVCNRDVSKKGNSVLTEIVSEIYSSATNTFLPMDTTRINEDDHPGLVNLVVGTVGKEGLFTLSWRGDLFRKWTNALEDANLEEELEEDSRHVVMWKCLSDNPEIILPTYMGRGMHHTDSVVSTLGIEMDRFLGVVRVNTSEIEDFDARMDQLFTACRGTMDKEYMRLVFSEDPENRYVTSVEVSGVVVSFSILKVMTSESGQINQFNKRSISETNSDDDRYVEVELLCASDYSGLGSHMMRSAEAFAVKKGAQHLTLTAVPDKVGWYLSQGFTPGNVADITLATGVDRGEDLREFFADMINLSRVSVPYDGVQRIFPDFSNDTVQETVKSIIGKDGYDRVRMNHPQIITEWNETLQDSVSMDLMDDGLLVMSKDITSVKRNA